MVQTKTGREIVLEHDIRYTKIQIGNFLANFKAKILAEQTATGGITKAMAYDKLITELKSRGFRNVTFEAVIQLSGDNLDFLAP